MTPKLDAVALLPEIVLTATLVAAFVLDLFVSERRRSMVVGTSIVGALAATGTALYLLAIERSAQMVGGAYVVDAFALGSKVLVLASVALVLLLGVKGDWRGEYCILVLAAALGMVLVPSTRDLIGFFVAFELLAVPGYMLAGWNKRSEFGHEAALKYYLLGVLATSVFLYGLSFVFGVTGSTLFTDIAAYDGDSGLYALALLFVLIGMAFKISAVPFHFWAPDTYQGAPVPVAAFLSVSSKAAGMVALLTLLLFAFPSEAETWAPILWLLAVASMTVGNLIALRQTDVIRLLAYSSIAQAGYLLVPLAVADGSTGSFDVAVEATFAYLVIYVVTNTAAFAVATRLVGNGSSLPIERLSGLLRTDPPAGVAMVVAMLGLAGIPPLAGWFAKFVIFDAAVGAADPWAYVLAVIVAVNTAIGLVYYAQVVRRMWIDAPVAEADADTSVEPMTSSTLAPTLYVSAALSVLLGVLPGLATALGSLSSPGQ